MKVRWIKWFAISILVMLGLPWLAVTFAPGDAGMAICLLLFYVLNPMYSIFIGGIAGQDVKDLWILPLLSAILFLIGVGIFFTISEPLFLAYAVVYRVLGMVALLIVSMVNKAKQKKEKD